MTTRTAISAVTIGLMLLALSAVAALAHPGAALGPSLYDTPPDDTLKLDIKPVQHGVFDPGGWGVMPRQRAPRCRPNHGWVLTPQPLAGLGLR